MDLETLSAEAQLIMSLVGLVAAVYGLLRWSNRKLGERILDALHEATHPISPGANGGLSLADVARRTETIERDITALKGQIEMLVRIYTEEEN